MCNRSAGSIANALPFGLAAYIYSGVIDVTEAAPATYRQPV